MACPADPVWSWLLIPASLVAVAQNFASSHERMKPGPQPTLRPWGSGNDSLCWFFRRLTGPTCNGPPSVPGWLDSELVMNFNRLSRQVAASAPDFLLPGIRCHATLSSHATHSRVYYSTIQQRHHLPSAL